MKDIEDKKICTLVKKGLQEDDPALYSSLIHKPKYYCKKCGLAVRSKKMVCKEVKIIKPDKKQKE